MKVFFNNTYLLTCWSVLFVTLSLTPWVNVDSLIIPKIAILLSSSLFFLPRIFNKKNYSVNNRITKMFYVISVLVLIQLLLVVFNSNAPIEQQIYGRTGRGLGFMTELSLIILALASCIYVTYQNLKTLLFVLLITASITSLYSLLQRFGFDFFDWVSRTNGIIGTLGNPNFQSSFAAMAIIPAIAYFATNKKSKYISPLMIVILVTVIYITQSTQGYLILFTSLTLLVLIYSWYRRRTIFFGTLSFALIIGTFAILGMVNKGFLSSYLYKPSVRSRGEFFRSAMNTAQDNPFFGVGLDSFGDYYWMYRDPKDINGIKEFADNAHNYFLNTASTGGFILIFLQTIIISLTLISFILIQRKIGKFNWNITAVFCSWVGYQMQSLISPTSISLLAWNSIISGSLIGLTVKEYSESSSIIEKVKYENRFAISTFLFFIGLLIVFPLYNADRLQLLSAKTGNAELAIKSAKSFPESTVRYKQISDAFLESGLKQQGLDLARSAVIFNSNSIASWGIILLSPLATYEERVNAQKEVLRLDPMNISVQNYIVPNSLELN